MLDPGKTGSNMAMVYTPMPKELSKKENGTVVKELNPLLDNRKREFLMYY